MYDVKRKHAKYNLDNRDHMDDYEDILNNPLCSIVSEKIEKTRDETYNDDGRLTRSEETLWRIIVYDEKLLLE